MTQREKNALGPHRTKLEAFQDQRQAPLGQSDEQLDLIAGKRDQLACKIEQVYGVSTELAERQLAAWQSAQRKSSSPFK
jgi:hypothetical protein